MAGEQDTDATAPTSVAEPATPSAASSSRFGGAREPVRARSRLLVLQGGRSRRAVLLSAAFVAPCAVIALSVWSIARDTERRRGSEPAKVEPATPKPPDSGAAVMAPPPATAASSAASPLEGAASAPPEFLDETDDGEPPAKSKAPPKRYTTVRAAAAESCSTASVEGLSRQIIEQARCTNPNAFVPLPPRPNLVVASNVFPFLERDARDHLLRALDAHPTKKMTINSALRTVAQQYLVSVWAAGGRCGVQLATRPGESNHEIGAALDIAEPGLWRPALEAHDFKWLGASDRVHFDFKPKRSAPGTVADVLAFQILWNRNHADDPITADGRYTPATEQRLKKAPPAGFAKGASCGGATKRSSPKK